MALKLSPKTITGFLHNQNKNCCDWGWQGQLAYGCQNLVVVVDPLTVQVVQALDKHKGYVVKVKWGKENYQHDLASPYTLRLASADYNGKIIVWNVAQSAVLAEFSDSSKPVADMEWLRSQDVSQDLLAVLHPPYSLILWNAATGTKLWKKSYTDNLISFSFDPFDPCKLAFLGQDSILFVDDFSLSKTPSSNGRKYFISAPSSQNGVSQSASNDKLSDKKNRSTIKIVSSILVGGDTTKRSGSEEPENVNECLQLLYHRACRHHLILLYTRDILVLDLEINQTVGIIPLERTGSPYAQMMSMRQRDVFVCLHENGGISVRMRRKAKEVTLSSDFGDDGSSQSSVAGVTYDLKCTSDSVRLTRHVKVYGFHTCPVSENKVAILLSDGRVLIWKLTTMDHQVTSQRSPQSPLFTPGLPVKTENVPLHPTLNLDSTTPYPKTTLADLVTQPINRSMTQSLSQTMSQSQTSEAVSAEGGKGKHGVQLKFVLSGLLHGLAQPPFIIKMCPPLTTKNWAVYQPLLAVGSDTGNVQVYNMSGGFMSREFSIHTCPVRGIEWCSLHSFMSFASSNAASNGLVKNEIILTDIQSGRSEAIRSLRDEESPIEMIRVSHLKQYFVVVFKDKPFELWDLKTCAMLRQMPRHFPKVTALEWSPSPGTKKKSLQDASVLSASSMDLSATTPSAETPSRGFQPKSADTGPIREHFVFTDTDGLLYHFLIEGNMVKDGTKIPPDGSMSTISSIAWKGETLVLGDIEGNLNIWDLKNRISKAVPTHKGWIRRMKFAPGRGNMKLIVLHTDCVEIWDAKTVELISSLRTPKDVAKVTDSDWVASDKPALACADGCLRVMDLHFNTGCSPLHDYQLQEPVFSPHLLGPKAAQNLKCVLQHQPWCDNYTLSLDENEQNTEICALVNEQLQLMDSEIKDYLLGCHFGTAHRCLITARMFGDESELNFWTVALHYIRAEKAEPSCQKIPKSPSSQSTGDLFIPNTAVKETRDLLDLDENGHNSGESRSWSFIKDSPLERCYDVLCDNATFQKYQLERVCLHDSKRSTAEHTHKCAQNLMLLGQTDRAVQLLLETDATHETYYVDSLRACLVASIRSSGASQSTIKLVATNLIANGKLSEGVQLLCLIDKGLDACRYLQTYGEWHQASWLAKATLEHNESKEVMKRWAEHLSTPHVNQKSLAVLVMLSLAQFGKVIEMLYGMRQFERATLFIEALQQFALLPKSDETNSICEAVYLEYARYLLNLANRRAAEYYCGKAGEKGVQLLHEITAAFSH